MATEGNAKMEKSGMYPDKNETTPKKDIETFLVQRGFHKPGVSGDENKSFTVKTNGNLKSDSNNGLNSAWAGASHIILANWTKIFTASAMDAQIDSFLTTLNKNKENGKEKFVYRPLVTDGTNVGNYKYEVFRVKNENSVWVQDLGYKKTDFLKNLVGNSDSVKATGGLTFSKTMQSYFASCGRTEQRYIKSLLAKPFVILTGNSGTGKTRIAKKIAEYYTSKTPDIKKNITELFEYVRDNNITMNGIRLKSVSSNAIEAYNTKDKCVCISHGIIREYVEWYKSNGIDSKPVRKSMQAQGDYDGQSYSWDSSHLEKIAKFVYEYEQKKGQDICLKNSLLVPVGADWTDNTKILGYYNPIADDGKGRYIKSDILEFIELANENANIPFFLILDEMNLSHVERYFSDFLSKMETPDEDFNIEHYGKVKYPKNLFVTGTVNIDETTYMFSPKVLDRANVIEFCPEIEDVLGCLTSEKNGNCGLQGCFGDAVEFMTLAQKIQGGKFPQELKQKVEPYISIAGKDGKNEDGLLTKIYVALKECNFEFAYRTMKEIQQYVFASYELCDNKNDLNIDIILDEQIVQKILPKLHGNKKQIWGLLTQLSDLLKDYKGLYCIESFNPLGVFHIKNALNCFIK